jgi:fatty acid desaturase
MTTLLKPSKSTSSYTEVLRRVKEAGLLKKKPSFYIIRFIIISIASLAVWAGVYAIHTLSSEWYAFAVPLVILLGIISAQYGFIAHEAAHRQVFNSNKINDASGIILANLFAGLSYGFWMRKHNRHHNKPNQIDYDPDIAIRVVSFTPESLKQKKGVEKVISRNQGWLFPILLTLTGFDLLMDSFVSVSRKGKVKHRALEFVLMLVRQTTPIVLLVLMFGWWGVAFWLIMMMSFGFFMGGAFAPNHKGMPLVPKDSKIDFFQRQVLTSRNVTSSWFKDNFMGGLNFQVEHHLFPSMARPNLKKAQVIVKQYCKEVGVPFTEMGWFQSMGKVIQYVNKVGLSERDPFVCPMVATLRPRN